MEVESGVASLRDRCQKLVKGSKQYRDGIQVLSESQLEFADYLEAFCGGPEGSTTDSESLLLGERGPPPLPGRGSRVL
jgi:hypothetical protein